LSRARLCWLLVGGLLLQGELAWAQPVSLEGIGFDEALTGPPVLAQAMGVTPRELFPRSLNVRLHVPHDAVERQPGSYDFDALDARVAAYGAITGVSVYLDLGDEVPPLDRLAERTRYLRAVAARYRTSVRGYVVNVPPAGARPPAPQFAFLLKTTVVDLRSGDDGAIAILGGISDADDAYLEALYAEDVAAYVDAVGLAAGSTSSVVLLLIERRDPGASLLVLGAALGDDASAAAGQLLTHYLDTLGSPFKAVTYAATPAVAAATMPVVMLLREMLGQPMVSIDEPQVGLRLTRLGDDVTSRVSHRLVFGMRSLTNYFVYTASDGPLELRLTDPTGVRPVVVDVLAGTRRPADSWTHDPATRVTTVGLPAAGRPVVIDWNTGDRSSYTEMSEVSSPVLPSLAEIISRHQQVQGAQDALVSTYIADATMEHHFRATAADLAFDVVTENTFFVEGSRTEFEERSFRLNGTPWGADRPPFPLLQAEKVLSLPLDLRLTSDYRYRLEGVEQVDGRQAFVIRFDPVDVARSLYRGTVWIDRVTFRTVKVQTVQTSLSAPVLSSEEIQHFTEAGTVDGRPVVLLTRFVGRQSILIAGRNLLLEREVLFGDFQINPVDFDARRQAARAGDHVMYRDTDQGVRYLVKRDGARVVDTNTTTTATALLLGVTYDPAYDFPLPLGGLNYLDFEFMGKDNQLAVTFGGVLALVNLQRPHLVGKSVDGSLDLFAIAVPGSDRTYDSQGERPGERVRTLPFTTGTNVGWRFAEFNRLVGSYQFRYDWYSTEDTTSATFAPPASTVTNGVGLAWEWKQNAYSVTASWAGYRRARWQAWGTAGDYDPSHRDYAKYSVSATKVFFTGVHKFTFNGAYYGGRDLDRFSKYQFGFFDENRMRGVPSAGVRFEELGMIRGAYSFNLFDVYRLDLYLDQAMGRDRSVLPDWQPVTGIGLAFNLRGPRNTMLRGDIGKSFLPSRYSEPGSIVFQLQVLKPL